MTGTGTDTLEIDANGLTFRARVAGPEDGRVVLLLHGFPQTSRCWAAQLDALATAGYRAVAVDQRGYSPGARPDDPAAYAMDHLIDDVLGIVDALDADQVDLVGHDFGGSVAWTVAGHHPDRVRTLTIASTPHPVAFVRAYQARDATPSDQNQRSGYMRAFREAPRGQIEAQLLADGAAGLRQAYAGLPEASIAAHIEDMSAPGVLVAAVDWYRAMSAKASVAVPPCPAPTLYVWSDRDPSIGRAAADATEELVTGPYDFVVLEGVSHWIPEQAAATFTPLLLAHLAGRRSG
ncbi:MAG TPA: alpha/beta hydrolase [Acidimicrobiales bacterium]|nr:alpha/beta hydrolase [Acidimicrobiales bacterium]